MSTIATTKLLWLVPWSDDALVERGTRLIWWLLAFSRTQRLDRRPSRLIGLLTGVLDRIEAGPIGVAIQLETDLAEDLDQVQAGADPPRHLAMLNVGLNAFAMPDGGRPLSTDESRWSPAIVLAGEFVEIGVTLWHQHRLTMRGLASIVAGGLAVMLPYLP